MITKPEIIKNFKFVREDWSTFRFVERLSQRAGVPISKLRRLVVKELVDNALDAGANCKFGHLTEGGFYIEDDGPGISPDELPHVFSINRPLETTKLWRLPTRGALGNGLRFVTGAVAASSGTLTVYTHDQRCDLVPQEDGSTAAKFTTVLMRTGTRVEVCLGSNIPEDENLFLWGIISNVLNRGKFYEGSTSIWWYTLDAFFELLQAAGSVPVREMVTRFEGCSGRKAGQIANQFLRKACGDLTRDESAGLLLSMRNESRHVNPARLGYVGENYIGSGYSKITGDFGVKLGDGTGHAIVPFVIETWAGEMEHDDLILLSVNRSPIAAELRTQRDKNKIGIFGCELANAVTVGSDPVQVHINIMTPFLFTMNESKVPNLRHLWPKISDGIEKATRRLSRKRPAQKVFTEKDLIRESIPDGINQASGNGQFRFSLRQLYYVIRPAVLDNLKKESSYNYFSQVVSEYENEFGVIPGLYRDVRGVLYHPHLHEEIPLGTQSVERYERPEWTFNKILYCEKEGFFPILRAVKWPERHDCALVTSKGYASRAVKDLFDFLGETQEQISFYCIHDCDGPGTLIYETLVRETLARGGRTVNVVNLGLDCGEALAMGLQVETITRGSVPVAEYVSDTDREWLQGHRVELNAMTTPQFLKWLGSKFDKLDQKIIPPRPVLSDFLFEGVRQKSEDILADRILREADHKRQVENAMRELQTIIDESVTHLPKMIMQSFTEDPAQHWTDSVDSQAQSIADLI